jgi:hypothetical protein
MSERTDGNELGMIGALAITEASLQEFLRVNATLADRGMSLTQHEIRDVLTARQRSLAENARLQWSIDLTEKILVRASESPYVERDHLTDAVNDWNEVILALFNQMSDFVEDDEVLKAVSDYYDNYCAGDVELLRGKATERILVNFNKNRDLSYGYQDIPGIKDTFEDEAEREEEKPAMEPEPTSPAKAKMNEFAPRTFYTASSAREDVSSARENTPSGAQGERQTTSGAQGERQTVKNTLRTVKTGETQADEWLMLFKEELVHYVGDGSTSVSEKNARSLFASIRYTAALAQDTTGSAAERFAEGQLKILSLMSECEKLYHTIVDMEVHLPLDTYFGTLYREIPNFFRKYDGQYSAQESAALMDYPLAIEIEDLSGILYIHEYLMKLLAETKYSRLVTEDLRDELILAYGRKYAMVVTSFPVNFFEILMGQAFVVALRMDHENGDPASVFGNPDRMPLPEDWLLSRYVYEPALSALEAMSPDDRRIKLSAICEKVCAVLPDADAAAYARIYADRWIELFESAIENRYASNMILFPENESRYSGEDPVYFADGEPMDNEAYTELIEKLSCAENVEEQNRLVRENIQSRRDLLDLLAEDFWMPGEKERFIATFSPEEQALLDASYGEEEPVPGSD